MPLRQHLNGIQRTFVSRFPAMLVTRVAEFHVGGGTTTATRTTGRTVVIVIHGTTTTRSLIIITFIVIIRATTANRTGFDLILGIRGTTATANRTHRLGLVPRLRILGLRLGCRQLRLLEQRGRGMLLDLEFKAPAAPTPRTTRRPPRRRRGAGTVESAFADTTASISSKPSLVLLGTMLLATRCNRIACLHGFVRSSHHALTVTAHLGARRKQLPSKVFIMRRRTPALADKKESHARGSTPSDASAVCRTTAYKYDTKNNGT